MFLLAFRKTLKVNGQEYSLDLIDTAGQVSQQVIKYLLCRFVIPNASYSADQQCLF